MVSGLRKVRTPEEIKRGSMHSTNKGFDRYFQIVMEDVRGIYRDATGDTKKGAGPHQTYPLFILTNARDAGIWTSSPRTPLSTPVIKILT